MDEYAEIYFLDEDEDMRNATRDHRGPRTGSGGTGMIRRPARRPSGMVVRAPVGRATVVRQQPEQAESRLAGVNLATLAEAGSQLIAALVMQLPAAPVATGKAETDLENMVAYQTALAQHAKRDEQIRTFGSLLAKLLG